MMIPEKILAQCHMYGVEAYPEEACGFIVGIREDQDSLETVLPMQNIMNELHEKDPEQFPRTSLDGYMIDPREQMILERSLKKEGKEIKVIYHSHPDVGAYFSEKDKEDAMWNGRARYPGITFLVCATTNGKPDGAILADFNENSGDFDITTILPVFIFNVCRIGGRYLWSYWNFAHHQIYSRMEKRRPSAGTRIFSFCSTSPSQGSTAKIVCPLQ